MQLELDDLPSQEEIMTNWTTSDTPLLSIACIAYNHVNFIEDALKGFLIQKTTFPFEIVVHDDASNDGTAEIVRSYQFRYPKLIRVISQSENQYSQGKRILVLIYPELYGRYVAVCEGDDYWVDQYKLQKQVDFLEANPEYVITGHDASIVDENGALIQASKLPDKHKRDYSAKELQEGQSFILTLSWVFRRVLRNDEAVAERSVVKNGDDFLLSLLGQYGGSYYHADIEPAVYRVHEGGVWSMLDRKSRKQAHATTFLMISNYYRRIGEDAMADVWWQRVEKLMLVHLSTSKLCKEILIRLSLIRKIRTSLNRIRSLFIGSQK